MRVLVVEDETKMAALISRGLVEEGYAADVAGSGEDAVWMAQAAAYDAIVLDVMLPGLNGVDVCRSLREDGIWSPILMLTARDGVEDRVRGLDSGADDYLSKPTGLFLYSWLGAALERTIDRSLDARARDVGALVRRSDAAGAGGLTQVLGPEGRVLAGSPQSPLLDTADVAKARQAGMRVERPVPGSDEAARLLALPLDTDRGQRIVVVGTSLEQRGDALENLVGALLVGGPLALLLASLAGYALAAAALRPVESMRREAEAVSAAEPGRRLPLPPAQDEIARLGETLNRMLGRLETALERERRFVADASHELRTPLAVLRTELEVALRHPRTREQLEAALRSAAEETERLSQLAEDLLVLARAHGGQLPVRKEPLRAAELFESVTRRYARRAAESGRRLDVEAGRELVVSADRLRAEQALGNLVDNALRHGSGPIRLRASAHDGRIELHVTDEGAGFARDGFTRGGGLGLAIVDAIARAHGGSMHALNRDGGADVWLELPR